MLGDNLYGSERPEDLRKQVRAALQAPARRGRQVLRGARQPRRSQPALLQAVQHERRALLLVQAAARERPLLRPRQQLHGQDAARRGSRRSCAPAIPSGRSASSTIRSIRRARSTAPTTTLREQLEPLFLKYGVDVVLHRPRAFLRAHQAAEGHLLHHRGERREAAPRATSDRSGSTAKGFDQGYAFILMEIVGDRLHFQTITDDGRTVDSGDACSDASTRPRRRRAGLELRHARDGQDHRHRDLDGLDTALPFDVGPLVWRVRPAAGTAAADGHGRNAHVHRHVGVRAADRVVRRQAEGFDDGGRRLHDRRRRRAFRRRDDRQSVSDRLRSSLRGSSGRRSPRRRPA